ncbi:energy transducer TonB [Tenacibaculum maritimum]|uniref:energy transducer TonB n=1 Tax=Tenacibaculum maritimum TaxID=107401 RepID=UPI0012E4EF53|nr:energy transducer TonB [Tenacibaculum maritimum]CAA0228856.1 TonB family protein [Tenacibaculum maritimum]
MKKLLLLFTSFILSFAQAQTNEPIKDVPFSIIDEAPTFYGCDSLLNNKEKKRCLNLGMTRHIRKHFDVAIANCLKKEMVYNEKTKKEEEQCVSILPSGKKRIYLQFKIGKTGNVEDIVARAPHPKLKAEAIRVAKLIPPMIPGKQKGKAVRVGYTLPITFNVE